MPDLPSLRRYLLPRLQQLARSRPNWMVNFAIEEANLSEGLRAATASTSMLLLGLLLHDSTFTWAAFGAFWTCLADASGSSRKRLASMLSFSLFSTLCGGITAFAAVTGTTGGGLAIFCIAALAGLVRIWGLAAYQVAILVATTCVVMVDKPLHSAEQAIPFLSTYLGGCLFATLLSFTVWRIHRFGPSRYALRLAYTRLGELARDAAWLIQYGHSENTAELRAQTRSALETARRTLQNLSAITMESQQQRYAALQMALADAETAFNSLIATAHADQVITLSPAQRRRAARCLESLGHILQQTGAVLADHSSHYPLPQRARLPRFTARLEQAFGHSMVLPFCTETHLPPPPPQPRSWWSSLMEAIKQGWGTLAQQLVSNPIHRRFALRLGLATTLTYSIVDVLNLHYGYWATMAALLIVQPSVATTWARSMERAAGSLVGAVLAVSLGHLIHNPWVLSLTVFPLICLTMALRPVSYSLFVVFLTPSFVLVADSITPSQEVIYSLMRLGNNVLGCVIGMLATYLLWPNRDSKNLRQVVNEAVQANVAYLAATLEQHRDSENFRRAAGLASTRAEQVYRLVQMESRQHPDAKLAARVLPLLRLLASTAAQVHAQADQSDQCRQLADWLHQLAKQWPVLPTSSYQGANLNAVEKLAQQQIAELLQQYQAEVGQAA